MSLCASTYFVLWIAQCRNELKASGLCIGILLMLERQIEEEPLVAVERLR